MLVPLRSRTRRALLRAAMCALVAAAAGVPLALPVAVPADPQPRGLPPLALALDPQTSTEPALPVERDPFVPEAAEDDRRASVARATVEAVAFGAQPQAVVREGAASRIVRVGDALEGSTIATIDERGIGLASGERLPLAGTP